ncbi:MAG: histone deacetylase family protein, partial [Dissulfurimicrobium sp.]
MHDTDATILKKTIGVVRDQRFLEHIPGLGHIESPERLKAVYERLDKGDAKGLYQTIAPRMAIKDELAWNHNKGYIERIEETQFHNFTQLDPDTITSNGSWQAACLAVGGVFSLLDAIFSGKFSSGLALVRPPGHHAERGKAMGFCLFNNVALGAHYARKVLGLKRVLIVDWDLHHGNGTQDSFYHDPNILYFSSHQ